MSLPGQPATAPPPTAGTALATTKPKGIDVAQGMSLLGIAGGDGREIERIETAVTIPVDYQYAIPIKGKKNPDGTWDNSAAKVGLTADAYDYLNRVVGVSFFLPEWVHNEKGEQQRNPIHRKDYIYLRMGAVWYSPLGQLLLATEDVEVDFNLTWMDARINSPSASVVIDDTTGLPRFDDFGNPAVKLDPAAELKALKTLSQLRTFGPRYAQTVARVRLLKMAIGIRSLPLTQPKAIQLMVVGYRDKLTAQQRIEKAGGDLQTIYGAKPPEVKPLTQQEMEEVAPEVDPDTEQLDREAIARQATTVDQPDDAEIDGIMDKVPTPGQTA